MSGNSLDLGRSDAGTGRADGEPGPQGMGREASNINACVSGALAQDYSDLRGRQG